MPDEIDRIATGVWHMATGLATLDVIKGVEGLTTVLGLETNASEVQKLVAVEHESFVFDTLLALKGESTQHTKRLDTFEQRQSRMSWVMDEFERRLGEQGAVPSDLVALLEASSKVWKATADAKKRKLLANGLLNAFDPTQYEEGQTLRLFDILAQLTYGEIFILRLYGDQFAAWPKKPESEVVVVTSSNLERLRRRTAMPLCSADLPLRVADVRAGSLLGDHIKRLGDHGLICTRHRGWELDGKSTHQSLEMHEPSELGKRLLALTAAPGPRPDATPRRPE